MALFKSPSLVLSRPEGEDCVPATFPPPRVPLLFLGRAVDALLLKAAHIHANGRPGLLKGPVAGGFPPGAKVVQQNLVLRVGDRPLPTAKALSSTTFFGCLAVVALEIVLGITLDAIQLAVGEHQVEVGLISAVHRLRDMNRPLIGMAASDFLSNERTGQSHILRIRQVTRKRDEKLAVGRPVLALVRIRGLPEADRVVSGPLRHVAELRRE
jgi:hypothetical protein